MGIHVVRIKKARERDEETKRERERTMLAVSASHFLTNMSIALYAWSRTVLRAQKDGISETERARQAQGRPSECRPAGDALFAVDEADRHGRDDLAGEVLLLKHLARRHEGHEACAPCMHERVPEGARKSRDEDLALGGRLEVARQAREEDARVGADARLDVGLRLAEDAQEVVIEDAVVEL